MSSASKLLAGWTASDAIQECREACGWHGYLSILTQPPPPQLMGGEVYAMSSASKPLAGWTVRDAIQECRERCGGHGYL